VNQLSIKGYGYALGDQLITNKQLEAVVDTSDEWITSRSGIKTRSLSTQYNTSDLATQAAQQAIADAGINTQDIDCIIVATMTPDHMTPATAPLVQYNLGLNDQPCIAFDINAACTGFIYALQVASSMITAKQVKHALVIGAETFSKIMDYTDRSTSVLFGDGAGAVVLSQSNSTQEMTFYTRSKGDVKKLLFAKGLDLRSGLFNQKQEVGYLEMNGPEVFRFATYAMQDAITSVTNLANVTIEDIDLIIPHQANLRIIQHASKRLNINPEVFFTNLDVVGNTSAASIPIALAQAHQNNLLKDKKNIVLVGFGAGLTWGALHIQNLGEN
jgi:3-oxoacyl-[acyl-carrier-protein] synthase-3